MSDLATRLRAALSAPGSASSDFDLNRGMDPPRRSLTPAAVLVAIRRETETLILTKRSPRLLHHPGQVAFPGGKIDPTDADATAAALRAAQEEIGLPLQSVSVLGLLPPHETVTGFLAHPVLAIVDGPFTPVPEAGEVSEVFEVPLAHVADRRNLMVQSRFWQGQRRHYYVIPYGPYYVWGATARILAAFGERLSS